MPEYLAPAVYVEEVPSGNKPIEGVSTSTAGAVGVTQRGPVNTPTLITSFGEFNRVFGGYLDHRVFTSGMDALPYAVEGFFNNGGQRVYVSRIIGANGTFASVDLYGIPTSSTATTALSLRAPEGDAAILIDDSTNISSGDTVLLEDDVRSEYVTVQSTVVGVRLNANLRSNHAVATAAVVQTVAVGTDLTSQITGDMTAGGALALSTTAVAGLVAGQVLRIRDPADDTVTEYVTITDDASADFDEGTLLFDHPVASTEVHVVTLAEDTATTLSRAASADDHLVELRDSTGFTAGATITVGNEVYVVGNVVSLYGVRLHGTLRGNHAAGAAAAVQTVTEDAVLTGEITDDMSAGGGLSLSATAETALLAGQVLRIRDTVDDTLTEYVTITGDASADFDEGTLLFDHPQANTELHRVTLADGAATTLSRAASTGDHLVALTNTAGFDGDATIRVGSEVHVVRNTVASLSLATTSLQYNHAAGVAVYRQVPLLRVHAKDPGVWGNQLRIKTRPSSILETTVDGDVPAGETLVRLDAVFGLSMGSVLEFSRAGTVQAIARVINVNRATNEVELASGLTAALEDEDDVQSREFTLIVERLENDKVVQDEAFENLAVDADHLRYAPKMVGSFDRAADTASRSGASEMVRLSDLTKQDDGTDIAASLPNRMTLPYDGVSRTMTGGTDDLGSIGDNTYIGTSSDDPDGRTGIQSLRNEDAISIVAVPGQTSVTVQKALLIHAEQMRYRFAVLETPPDSNLKGAQTHRQNFDTTYGAIYYPWLTIADRFGEKGEILNIAPSGHVMGIYARTDVQRGVFKAPANEVVRGILGFQTALTKGEQDILNPVHVNCFRDFRTANRGLRLWGARTLSSDPEWKYVNVRRLFLFLEKSIENGMQFAVFESNTEALWGTVKRSISNFLVTVWRAGGLEGVTQEEAFFVDVGLNTMTQADIDNGRLIVNVGVAPVKPAEFVIIRISQKTREATS